MNAAIEEGIVAYLVALLPSSPPCGILAGTGMDVVPNAIPSVVCDISVKRHVGRLFYGSLKVRVTSPATVAGFDLSTHKTLVAAVREAFRDDAHLTALSAAVEASANMSVGGLFLEDVKDGRDANFWQVIFELNVGCREL